MDNHNTHIVSEQSKTEHGYKYDNFGNVIIDSIDDLIYDKFVDVKRKPKELNTKKFIKNIISKGEFPPVTPKNEEKKENHENEPGETEEKNQKKKSLINVNMIDSSKKENNEENEEMEEMEENEESEKGNIKDNNYNNKVKEQRKSKMNNNMNQKRKSNIENNVSNKNNNNYEDKKERNNNIKHENNDESDEENENSDSENKIETKYEKKKENPHQIKNRYNNKQESEEEEEESQSDTEEKKLEYEKQKLLQKRISHIMYPVKNNLTRKSKLNLNYSDDPIFNIKKVTDLKKMYNKKCFISPNQVDIELKAITELKSEEKQNHTINETGKFEYKSPRRSKHKKYTMEKQSEHSISPTKKSNIYDSSDDEYKNYEINRLNPYNYYAQNRYPKNIRSRMGDSKEDISKTDDKFLDSINIKENMKKNDFREERRYSNKEEDKQILNNVAKKDLSLLKRKKKGNDHKLKKKNDNNKNIVNYNDESEDNGKNREDNNKDGNLNYENDDKNNNRERKNIIGIGNNKNINKYREIEKEQNNFNNREYNYNIHNENNEEKYNFNDIDNHKRKSNSNSNNNNNISNNDIYKNAELKGKKNQNLVDKNLENYSKLGEISKNIINNNQTKLNMLSKLNIDEVKDNLNFGEGSKNILNSKDNKNESRDNYNLNNSDSIMNERKQRSNTQININENNLDKSDNKVFKDERTFKSINVYKKKPKEIKGKEKEIQDENGNILDIMDESNFNNLNMINGKVFNKKMNNGLQMEEVFSKSIKRNKEENTNNENIENLKLKINNKDNNTDNQNEIKVRQNINFDTFNKNENNKNNIIKEENNNNAISGIEIDNSNDNNESFKSIAAKVSNNIPSKNNSSFNKSIENDNKNKQLNNKKNNEFENNDQKEKNLIFDYNTEINQNKSLKKLNINVIANNSESKEEEIIFNKPILTVAYLKKIRQDIKMNQKPQKLNRVFITKTYSSPNKQNNLSIQEPLIIPKINICYTIKSNQIICINSKEGFMRKIVTNDCCFFTKLITNNLQPKVDSNMEDNPKLEDVDKKKKKKRKKKKKFKDSDDSYISVSVDNKNIIPNHKFKEDFILKNELLSKKYQKSTGYKPRNNKTGTNTKTLIKSSIPNLHLDKIKKNKDKYTIDGENDKNKKIKNNNETISSIGNISNKEIDDNKISKKIKKKNLFNKDSEYEKDNKNKKDNKSTKIRVHKFNKNKNNKENSNIKIKIKNPMSPNIEYQQIEIKPGAKGYNYRVIKKSNTNKFRTNKNYIKAKNKNDINDGAAIKIKSNLKPLKNSNNNLQNQIQDRNIPQNNNKSFSQNSGSYENQINIVFSNNLNGETHHMVGYDRHFGRESQCPLCRNMKKKTKQMEEKIFGLNKQPIIKPQTAHPTANNNDLNRRFRHKIFGVNKKEEEKNLNNNLFKDLNLYNVGENRNMMRPNIFRDIPRKFSAKRSVGMKNTYKLSNDHRIGLNRNSLGSFSDVEFPAINSYFHS